MAKTGFSNAAQMVAETGNYVLEKTATREPAYWQELAVRLEFTLAWSGLSGFASRPIPKEYERLVQAFPVFENARAGYTAAIEVVGGSYSCAVVEQVAPYPWTFHTEPSPPIEPTSSPSGGLSWEVKKLLR